MRLNHLDLPVRRPQATRDFFVQHLGFRCLFERPDGFVLLLDDSGFALTLNRLDDGAPAYPADFHVGFNLDSEQQVLDVHRALVAAGFDIARPLDRLAGALSFQCRAPGPVMVEFAWRPAPSGAAP